MDIQRDENILGRSHYDDMLIAMFPILICATVMYSFRVIALVRVAMITARVVDAAVATIRRTSLDKKDKSSVVAALIFVMMLPVSVPYYVVIVSVALAIFIGKHLFGGKEVYPFNLAALAMSLAVVNWPRQTLRAVKPFTRVNFWTGERVNTVSGTLMLHTGGLPYISTFDLLLGNNAGAMGTTFIIVLVAVGLYLLTEGRITWHAPVAFLATCAAISLIFPRIYGVSPMYSLKYEMLDSSLVFAAIFLLNEPATTPQKPNAKIAFGILCGALTMVFRYFGYFGIGSCFAILLVNATDEFWDRAFDEGGILTKQGIKEFVDGFKNRVRPISGSFKSREQGVNNSHTYKKPHQTEQNQQKKRSTPKDAFDMISRAEDDIDQVDYSTRTINVRELLKAMEEDDKE